MDSQKCEAFLAAVEQGSMSSRAPMMIAHINPKMMTLVELSLIFSDRNCIIDFMSISFN